MPRTYTCSYNGTLTNAGGNSDLLEATPADDKPIRLNRFVLGNSSELGDTAEEGLRVTVQMFPATVTSGSGGTATTPRPYDSVDAAAGFSAEMNNTTVATTSSTAVTLADFIWNIRMSPCEFVWPDPAKRPVVRGGEVLIVRMESTPADDITASLWFELDED